MGASCAHTKTLVTPWSGRLLGGLLALAGLFGSAVNALAATPPATDITNTASVSYAVAGTPVTATGSVTVRTTSATPATVEFLQFLPTSAGLPPGTASNQNVALTQCDAGTGFTPLPAPKLPGGATMTLPGTFLLGPANLYAGGNVVFVRVTDFDQNLDPLVAETLVVKVSSSNGDTESLRLTETGPSTGVFIGYVPSSNHAAQAGNCTLDVGYNQRLQAAYVDQSQGSVVVTAAALVDPLGLVFDSTTGLPVNGAQVTLINTATGLPATVLGTDGVSSYPSTVTSGGSATDGAGNVYTFPPGRYQFPNLAPGNYRLVVSGPAAYVFPTVVANPALQTLAGAPYKLVPGSRGEAFQLLPGPPLEIDLPIDPPASAGVQITKSAGKATVAVGEFVPYTLSITNAGTGPIAALHIADRLPPGFRYQAGSARLDTAVLPDPVVSADGRGLTFSPGVLAGSATVSLRYVAMVNPGAQLGLAENTAQAVGVRSNLARASVSVIEDLNRSTAILFGRVTLAGSCDRSDHDEDLPADFVGNRPVGLKGVRVLLQDGTYIVTDSEGRWHADNLRAGTHVVQLDETSLPKGYELQACEQNTRTGGRNLSQFVNLRGGSLWRADFRFRQVASCLNQQLQVQGKLVRVGLTAPVANQAVSATLMLPGDAKVIAGSVKLDGLPYSADLGDGYLVARLGAHAGRWSHVLEFELAQAPTADLSLRVQVQPIDQPSQGLPPLRLAAPATQAEQCAPMALSAAPVAVVSPGAATTAATATVGAVTASAATTAAQTAPPTATGTNPAVVSDQLIEKLPYDDKWIAAAAPGAEWLHPQTGFVPALPVVKVAVKHDAKHLVELKVNGALVDALRYEGTTMNPSGTLALSNWRAVEIRNGANQIEVTVRDAQGQTVLHESRSIHYAAGPATAAFDAQRSRLVADGRTSAVIAVRMLDKEGHPVRRGAGGVFEIAAPYRSQDQADAIQREPLTGNLGGKAQYKVGDDGVALIALQPTTQAGEVVLNFEFGNGARTQEVRAWLKPELRDWVLVGFAEGTAAFKTLSGNMESLGAAGADDKLVDQDRIAFYGKGQINGEYLMTLAYDTAKAGNRAGGPALAQAIDPNKVYTLYADATQPQFDAASTSKLYLKIEKSQFYALFGDYNTDLSMTELGRYSRTLNGLKSEYKGERLSYNAFASLTSQGFLKDEIQGDGTSGLYRLTHRDLLVNSDKVRLEVRDRFHPEVVISTQALTRYLDYQIDFASGTLSFTQPVNTRDANFNPVFIVAEYESASQADAQLTYGGRVAVKLGDKAVAGLTHIREGVVGREATLTALDTTIQLGEKTKLHAELAQSQRVGQAGPESGSASVVELTHNDGNLAARAYARQQDSGFGLGQQPAAAAGIRKVGGDMQVKISDNLQAKAEVFTQENQLSQTRSDVAQAQGVWQDKALTATAGLRLANETDTTGNTINTRQLLGGVGYDLLDKRLTLRANAELDISGPSDSPAYPSRLILGADYKLTAETSVFAQQEIARSSALQADTTRVGLRTRPWEGAEVATSLGNQSSTDGERLYGNLGLVQRWKINEQWSTDFGFDRSQTFRANTTNAMNPGQPLTSGTAASSLPAQAGGGGVSGAPALVTGDYTAMYLGGAYRNAEWSANARVERRLSDTDSKTNLLLGAQRNLEQGRAMAAGLNYARVDGALSNSLINARLSYANRPLNGALVWLDRLEYVDQAQPDAAGLGTVKTRKLINNFNANWLPNRSTQVAFQYGFKYVLDNLDGSAYSGVTDLVGLEVRKDINETLDLGLHLGSLRSLSAGSHDYQIGVSVGMKLADNAWLSIGYNHTGFSDPDFAGAQYRAQGVFLNLRFKFDEKTFNLNDRSQNPLQLKH
jgi:uncharacterized repeat protein (TIGR01451 family)